MKKRPLLKTGKKALACALSAVMTVAFTPTVAWGEGSSGSSNTDPSTRVDNVAVVDTSGDGSLNAEDTGYSTLAAALASISASGSSATVFLVKSTQESVTIGANTYVNLKLNSGVSITAPVASESSKSTPAIINNGNLDITGAGDGTSIISGNGTSSAILNNSLMSVCDVKVTNVGPAATIKTQTNSAYNITFLGNANETSTTVSNTGTGIAVENGKYCLLAISGKSSSSCTVSSKSGPTVLNKGFVSVSGGTVSYTGGVPTSTGNDPAAAAQNASAIATVNSDGSITANPEGSNITQVVIADGVVDGGNGFGIANLESYSLLEGTTSDSSMLITGKGTVVGGAGAAYLSSSTTIKPKIDGGTVGASGRAVIYAGDTSKAAGSITGGDFYADPTSYVAADYTAAAENGIWSVSLKRVAQIEGTSGTYPTLQAAIDAASNGSTITLLKSSEEAVSVPKDKTLTINIPEGVTLSSSGNYLVHTISNRGKLTLTGSGTVSGSIETIENVSYTGATLTIDGNLKIEANAHAIWVGNYTSATFKGSPTVTTQRGYCVFFGGSVRVEGGSFTFAENKAYSQSGVFGGVIKRQEPSRLTITDGTFTVQSGNFPVIEGYALVLNISGGAFTGSGPLFSLRDGSSTITGGNFSADPSAYVDAGNYRAYQKAGSSLWAVGRLYTIRFDANAADADFNFETTTAASGSLINPPTLEPERPGYYLDGWWAKDENGQLAKRWDFATDTMPEGNLTLYAKWAAIYYPDPTPITPPAAPSAPEVGDSASGVEIPTTSGDSGTAGSTKVDVTVTDTSATTDSKGNKVDGSVSIDKIETTGTAVAIPETITTDKGTFLVTSIPAGAMEGNSTAASVSIPDSVVSIGAGAFAGCTELVSVTIPAGVTTIEANTFSGCTNLTTVEVKGEVTEIAADAFNGCESLTSMTVAGTVKPLATRAASSALVIPASVTKIGDRAFKGTGITSVTVPAGVKMGTGVFRDCKQLTKAAVAKGVKTLGSYTFKGCSALKSVTIPGTVTKIERSAFSGCKSLAKVTIPKGVTSIGKNALYGASKVKTLTVNSKKLTKSSVKGALAGSKVTTVKVPKSMLKSYAKVFAKSVVGKAVKVRAI